jgi:hypothetical protein
VVDSRDAIVAAHTERFRRVQELCPEFDLALDLRMTQPRIHFRLPNMGDPLEYYLRSVEQSVAASLPLPALMTALTLPDILGAVEYGGISSTERYARWFDEYVRPPQILDGAACYALRCKLLHEGSLELAAAAAFKKSKHSNRLKNIVLSIDHAVRQQVGVGETLVVDGPELCTSIVEASREWYKKTSDTRRLRVAEFATATMNLEIRNLRASGLTFLAVRIAPREEGGPA